MKYRLLLLFFVLVVATISLRWKHRRDEISSVKAALEASSNQVKNLNVQIAQLMKGSGEARLTAEQLRDLMRLRAEVGELRKLKRQYEKEKSAAANESDSRASNDGEPPHPAARSVPRESWSFVGYDEPQLAFQSFMWALKNGDVPMFLHSLTPEAQESAIVRFQGKTMEEIANSISNEVSRLKVLRVDRQKPLSDSEIGFVVFATETDDGDTRTRDEALLSFKKVGNEWKSTGF